MLYNKFLFCGGVSMDLRLYFYLYRIAFDSVAIYMIFHVIFINKYIYRDDKTNFSPYALFCANC
ncbi:hypothetical protein CCAND93_360028 [Capnocytophaga canis]|uniref:Uncharacterized protein n=1 Tax=Capnocytophaga canis TaxID=1848903 RepID=A0A0B7IMJ4_9FLAO|nr:hypothetical protein CCAND93_360028 [Capnocytophaga canis]